MTDQKLSEISLYYLSDYIYISFWSSSEEVPPINRSKLRLPSKKKNTTETKKDWLTETDWTKTRFFAGDFFWERKWNKTCKPPNSHLKKFVIPEVNGENTVCDIHFSLNRKKDPWIIGIFLILSEKWRISNFRMDVSLIEVIVVVSFFLRTKVTCTTMLYAPAKWCLNPNFLEKRAAQFKIGFNFEL